MAYDNSTTPIEAAQQNDPSHTQPSSIPLPEQHLEPVVAVPTAPAVENAAAPAPVIAPQQPLELSPEEFQGIQPEKKTLTPGQFAKLTPKHGNLDSMMHVAPKAKEHIDAVGEKIREHMKSPHPLIKADVKRAERAKEKIENDYAGDHTKITDLVRNTVLVPSRKHLAEFVKVAKEHGALKTLHLKGDEDSFLGYSGAQAKFMTPQGIHGEVQANTPEMIVAKENPEIAKKLLGEEHFEKIAEKFKKAGIKLGSGHAFYEEARSMKPTAKNRAVLRELEMLSKKYYAAVRSIEED